MSSALLFLCLYGLPEGSAVRAEAEEEGLTDLSQSSSGSQLVNFPDMWFGLATAAPHVERAYPDDPWVAWAKRGHVAAYNSSIAGLDPDERLRFLEEPDVEIDLAANTGVKVFRLGLDWGRLVPYHPGYAGASVGIANRTALAQYQEVIKKIKAKGMKVMLTLFHHSMPMWSSAFGGWSEELTIDHFLGYAKSVAEELGKDIDYWCTFNEPHVYVLLSNCAGLWPPGPVKSTVDAGLCLKGALPFVDDDSVGYTRAMGHIQRAHIAFYKWAKNDASHLFAKDDGSIARIGVAHNVAENEAYSVTDVPSTYITEELFKFSFVNAIKGDLDWLGLNYYGKEILGGAGPVILESEEYSESGRTVHPDGMYNVLMQFHKRFPVGSEGVSFTGIIVTENGISDSSDILRPSYLIEHLLAIREAQYQGVNVEGYVHWTISDNWEWADGYCPKFGLVDVDRSSTDLTRTPRGSYHVFTEIVKNKRVSQEQRDAAWSTVYDAFTTGKTHPFCRAADGKTGLDMPVERAVVAKDWRFGKLSQGEDGACHTSPWRPHSPKADFAVKPDGSCDVLPSAKYRPQCPRAVAIVREKRCKDKQTETEEVYTVCAGTSTLPTGTKDCETGVSQYTQCCCSAFTSPKCGWMKGTLSNNCGTLRWANKKECRM